MRARGRRGICSWVTRKEPANFDRSHEDKATYRRQRGFGWPVTGESSHQAAEESEVAKMGRAAGAEYGDERSRVEVVVENKLSCTSMWH